MAGQVRFTPTEDDLVAGSRDWFRRMLMQPRTKGVLYITVLAGALLGVAFALQAGGPPDLALKAAALGALGGLLLVGVILGIRWALLPGQARRRFRQTKAAHAACTYAWTDEGIGWASEADKGHAAWRDLHRWGEGKGAFLFAVSERGIHFVPRRALGDAEAADLRATALRFGPARL